VKELLFESSLTELDKELDRLEGELAMDLDSPRSRASDLLLRHMFAPTGYGVSSSVMQEALPALQSNKAAFKERYKQLYTADRFVIAGSGDIQLQHLLDVLESSFVALPQGQAAVSIEQGLKQQAEALQALALTENKRVGYAWPDASQSHLFQAWYAPSVTHADYTPFLVLNTVLGAAGLSSRLFTELRDKQGLAYHVRSSLEGYKHRGLFSLYIGTDPANTAKCIAGFKSEIDKLLNTPVGAAELDATKRNMLGRRAVFLETSSQWTAYIGNNFLLGRTPEELHLIESQIKAVTAEDIQRVAQVYLSKLFLTSLAGPKAQVDALLAGTL
jgi:zinc protease